MEKDNYKPMTCPICEDFYFSNWQDGDEDCQFYCARCGWKYDLEQVENHNIATAINNLSLNEYKQWWQKKIAENPAYDYSEDNQPQKQPHLCPVCNKYQFDDMGSFDICPYCGWEDDDLQLNNPDYFGGANNLSLNEYQADYAAKIVKNPKYKWGK